MKIIILIMFLIASLICPNSSKVIAKTSYARIMNATNIYKLGTDDQIDNVICIAEKTYFVEILSELKELYKINYNGISGYIKKNDVKEITSTPNTPYPYNIKLTLSNDCNLRSSPTVKTTSSNVLTTLKANESNFQFIGRTFADEAIDFGGTTWYLVNYNGQIGYIYNKYVKNITPIYENTETVTFYTPQSTTISNPITNAPTLIIIIVMSIPLLAILFILYLPRKAKQKVKHIKQPKIKEKY